MYRLLVASEDSDLRRYVRITLERAGYSVAEARGRDEALVRSGAADLVVWDLAHGEAAGPVRQAVQAPLVMLASGLLDERPDGVPTLQKPFDPAELVQLCARVLHKPTA